MKIHQQMVLWRAISIERIKKTNPQVRVYKKVKSWELNLTITDFINTSIQFPQKHYKICLFISEMKPLLFNSTISTIFQGYEITPVQEDWRKAVNISTVFLNQMFKIFL